MPTLASAEPLLDFSTAAEWHAWLKANHTRSGAVWLRIAKKGAGASPSYAEALDAALTFGWIDSQKRKLDERAWAQRFGPRTAKSPWSKVNVAKAEALIASGTMAAAGLAEVERAKRDGRWARAYDGPRNAQVPPDLSAALAKNQRAKAFFEALDSANRFAILYRVGEAKKPETRADRIQKFVAMCAKHETLHPERAKKSAPKKKRTE